MVLHIPFMTNTSKKVNIDITFNTFFLPKSFPQKKIIVPKTHFNYP